MDRPKECHVGEESQTEKEIYLMASLICGILKMIQMNLFTKQKQTTRLKELTYD